MKKAVRTPLLAISVLITLFVSSAVGQSPNLYFNGKTQGNKYCGGPDGCVATGFFDGSINGVDVGPGQPGGPGMISDDYNAQLQKGENWAATGIQVSSLNAGNVGADTLFGSKIGIKGYAELAYLVNLMFTTNLSGSQLSAYSQALWYITGGLSWSELNSAARSLVNAAVAYAKKDGYSLAQYADLWLYVPNAKGAEVWGLVDAPEGGTAFLYLVLSGVSCLAAVFLGRPGKCGRRPS